MPTALLEVVNKVAALVVESRNADLAVQDVRPFSLLVPVKLSDDALPKTHVHAGELDTGGQLADSRLSGPTAFLSFGRWC